MEFFLKLWEVKGRGKTICALEICKHKEAKSVIILNNRLSILNGWDETVKKFKYDKDTAFMIMTDRALQNKLKGKSKLVCDILIIDEWQNMSSDKLTALYRKIKRKYTIGLSATPVCER